MNGNQIEHTQVPDFNISVKETTYKKAQWSQGALLLLRSIGFLRLVLVTPFSNCGALLETKAAPKVKTLNSFFSASSLRKYAVA
jgi:hypothetical protein